MLDPALDIGLLLFRSDGALDFANGRAQALFGCKDLRELEERLDGVRERLTPALKRLTPRSHLHGSVDVETTVEGHPRSLRLELSPVGEGGSEGFLAVVTDDDTMRALETDVRLAAHLRGLSRVSHATAHDIRTPLHTVVLYLELLRKTLAGGSEADTPVKQERYVEVIASEVQRLERMLDPLFSQTRVDEDTTERFDLLETVRELLLFLEPHCRRTRVQVHLKLADPPVMIEGSKAPLRHALLHILITAVEACPGGGEMDLSVAASDSKAVVTLRGEGAGSASSVAILDGSRGDPPTQRAFGPERGLSGARRVVRRQGGRIKARSGAKRAPTLEIQLPLAAAEV